MCGKGVWIRQLSIIVLAAAGLLATAPAAAEEPYPPSPPKEPWRVEPYGPLPPNVQVEIWSEPTFDPYEGIIIINVYGVDVKLTPIQTPESLPESPGLADGNLNVLTTEADAEGRAGFGIEFTAVGSALIEATGISSEILRSVTLTAADPESTPQAPPKESGGAAGSRQPLGPLAFGIGAPAVGLVIAQALLVRRRRGEPRKR